MEDGSVRMTTEFLFPEAMGTKKAVIDRQSDLFQALVKRLKNADEDCLYAIQLLEAARREARYDCNHLHPELEVALVRWRRQKAAELGYSAYVVLQQAVLMKIADAAPRTEEELLAIPGFGPGRFGRYGREILEITKAIPTQEDYVF